MAFTFEELQAWIPGKSYPYIACTLVITQEDGRTAYAAGSINSFLRPFAGDCWQEFSDRITEFRDGNGTLQRQPFTVQGNGIDNSTFEFTKPRQGSFNLKLTNKRWGATVNVALTKAAGAKLYTGWGATIAAGSGQALYVFSINSAVETPG